MLNPFYLLKLEADLLSCREFKNEKTMSGESIKLAATISTELLLKAFRLMCIEKALTEKYEANAKLTSKYVHATARGHEAVQIALGMQLTPKDFLSLYYRDDAVLLGLGLSPYELMLQLFCKRDDPFSGGRTYYGHPSLKRDDMPKIPHQSSATGMQMIPATGLAMGIQYREKTGMDAPALSYEDNPIVVCSIGDAAMTEGEVSEAMQMAALKRLPILYFVQDNGWDISAYKDEVHTMNAQEYAQGFKHIETRSIDGTNFIESYQTIQEVIGIIRKERRPFLIHAEVPLLGHHTSGVRMEWYRDDLESAWLRDPFPKMRYLLLEYGVTEETLLSIENETKQLVDVDFEKARYSPDPLPEDLFKFDFAPTIVTEEVGERVPDGGEQTLMVDCALHAVEEIMRKHPEALLYGQDVGKRLGGVFREAATLAQKFGDDRVFNTPIVEAFIIGSTVGMSNAGLKPIVEVQFGDYIWPGLNQLFTELSRSYYLSNGKWSVGSVIRVPVGAYGSGGPFHSSSIESVLSNIRGIKVAYPSNGADMKGLMKAAFLDPNPVVMLEHKGLYWSKVKGTELAKVIEPDEEYIIPLGKGRIFLQAEQEKIDKGESMLAIAWGMGVHWANNAAKEFPGQVEVLDIRTIYPLDEALIYERAKVHGKCLVITEEPVINSFAQSIAGRINEYCFEALDAPVKVIGAENIPAIPLNEILEKAMLPNADKVAAKMSELLDY
jgi:2-oxoisovalerate dehydrogenase E1 component